jgi:hypothetical protein
VRRFLDARAERAAGRARDTLLLSKRIGICVRTAKLARLASAASATNESGGEAEIAGGVGCGVGPRRGVYGELVGRLTAKALRLMQYWRNIRLRNFGTGNRLPESTSDWMIYCTRTARSSSPTAAVPIRDLRLPIGSGREASESSRYVEASQSGCKSPALL